MEAILENVRNGSLKTICDVELVFANKPDAEGLKIAEKYGVNTAFIGSKGKKREVFDQQVVEYLKPLNIDYIVLAGFMRILSPLFIRIYKNRIINIHPADTDEFQGIGAYEWAFENKLQSTKLLCIL